MQESLCAFCRNTGQGECYFSMSEAQRAKAREEIIKKLASAGLLVPHATAPAPAKLERICTRNTARAHISTHI